MRFIFYPHSLRQQSHGLLKAKSSRPVSGLSVFFNMQTPASSICSDSCRVPYTTPLIRHFRHSQVLFTDSFKGFLRHLLWHEFIGLTPPTSMAPSIAAPQTFFLFFLPRRTVLVVENHETSVFVERRPIALFRRSRMDLRSSSFSSFAGFLISIPHPFVPFGIVSSPFFLEIQPLPPPGFYHRKIDPSVLLSIFSPLPSLPSKEDLGRLPPRSLGLCASTS